MIVLELPSPGKLCFYRIDQIDHLISFIDAVFPWYAYCKVIIFYTNGGGSKADPFLPSG